jgi:hypothetical protein
LINPRKHTEDVIRFVNRGAVHYHSVLKHDIEAWTPEHSCEVHEKLVCEELEAKR